MKNIQQGDGSSFLCVKFAPDDGVVLKTIKVAGTFLGLLIILGSIAAFASGIALSKYDFFVLIGMAGGMLGLALYIIGSRPY